MHLCLISDVCDPSCSRKMYLKVRFPALCDLAYKYWISCEILAERSSSEDLFKGIVILYVAAIFSCKIIVTKKSHEYHYRARVPP